MLNFGGNMWSLAFAWLLAHSPIIAAQADISTIYSNVSIFTVPDRNYSSYVSPKVLYARTVVLNHGCPTNPPLLATWENYSPEPPYFPIFQSNDQGKTWKEISRVQDQV